MSIEATFKCTYIAKASDGSRIDAYFDPVLEEGKPSGNIYITLTDPSTFESLKEGVVYKLTISE